MNLTSDIVIRSVDGDNKNAIIISSETDFAFKKQIRTRVKGYTTNRLTDKILGTERHVNNGLIVSNLFTCKE